MAHSVFQLGQMALLLFALGLQNLRLLIAIGTLAGQAFDFLLGLNRLLMPLGGLGFDLFDARQGALATLDDKSNLRFKLAHIRTGFIQQPLTLIDLVTGGIVGLADRFQIGFNVAQIGDFGFQAIGRLQDAFLQLGLIGQGFGTLQKPKLLLFQADLLLQVFIALGDLGLAFKLFQIGIELAQDVFDTGEVFTRVAQAVFGLAAALFVFGDAGRLFQKQAQLFGLGLNDAADRALTNDGVGPGPQTGAQKHILHIAAAHRLVVDVVAAGAVSGQHPFDRNFGKLTPLPARAVVTVVKNQFDTGAAGRFSSGGAIEDDVLHGLAAQLAGTALAQHPTHRVDDVGFAAAIGAHHTHQLTGQHEMGGFGKRLEAG